MSLVNAAETDWLDLLITNVDWAEVGDAGGLRGSVAAGVFGIACHTGNATDDTDTVQATDECDYTGYTRQSVARSTAGWTVTGNLADNDAAITFGEMTGGASDTITDISLGEQTGDPSTMFMHADAAQDLIVNTGVNPEIAAGALDITAD